MYIPCIIILPRKKKNICPSIVPTPPRPLCIRLAVSCGRTLATIELDTVQRVF